MAGAATPSTTDQQLCPLMLGGFVNNSVVDLLSWSSWSALRQSWYGTVVPALPGLYRIRRVGHGDLDYIGQTGMGGMTLRKRLGMLRGVYADEMPYRDPHTAGPALWALRHSTGCDFEVAATPVAGTTPWRKGLEAVAIGLYRQERGASPTVEFGRMPVGYRMSSGNSARIVATGKRAKGGPMADSQASSTPSIPPVGPLSGEPCGPTWCGHRWSAWGPVEESGHLLDRHASGLYRIRATGHPSLLYIGQGKVQARLRAHQQKVADGGNRQGRIFGDADRLDCSWVLGEAWLPPQLLELETDLIAAYVLNTETIPAAQFLG